MKILLRAIVFYQYTNHPVIVVTDIFNNVMVSFKSVNIHKKCIVLKDDNPLRCDFDYESYLRMTCIGLLSCISFFYTTDT